MAKKQVDTNSLPYKQGVCDFNSGKSSKENPYASEDGNSPERYGWYMGWYDMQLAPLHAKLDESIKLKTLAKTNRITLNLIKEDDYDGECQGNR